MRERVVPPAGERADRLPRRPHLFRRPYVGLPPFDPFLRARNLALVSLQYSFFHPIS